MDTGYLSQQVTTIINQLHGFFDEIGVPSHERDSRESEVSTSCIFLRDMADLKCSYFPRCLKRCITNSSRSQRAYIQIRAHDVPADTFSREKHDLTEKAQGLIKAIRQMEVALDDTKPQDDDYLANSNLQVTYPLLACIQSLKEKYHTLGKIHRERYEQVKSMPRDINLRSTWLTMSRTCRSSSILRITSGVVICNNQASTVFSQCQTFARI